MANRSYLYIKKEINENEEIIGIGEYNYNLPLIYKILSSFETETGKSIICNVKEKIAIYSEVTEGVELLKKFLNRLKKEKISFGNKKTLVSEEMYSEIINFFSDEKIKIGGNNKFILECFELYEMSVDLDEFEDYTLEDIISIKEIKQEVINFIETGNLSEKLWKEIDSYEVFQYSLKSFSDYLYYDFSGDFEEEDYGEDYNEDYEEKVSEKIETRPRIMDWNKETIIGIFSFIVLFPPVGIYLAYSGFKDNCEDKYTNGVLLGSVGLVLLFIYAKALISKII